MVLLCGAHRLESIVQLKPDEEETHCAHCLNQLMNPEVNVLNVSEVSSDLFRILSSVLILINVLELVDV